MNDHELARKLARETGTLLIGLRNHAASLSGGEDETHSVLAEEVLGSEGSTRRRAESKQERSP